MHVGFVLVCGLIDIDLCNCTSLIRIALQPSLTQLYLGHVQCRLSADALGLLVQALCISVNDAMNA